MAAHWPGGNDREAEGALEAEGLPVDLVVSPVEILASHSGHRDLRLVICLVPEYFNVVYRYFEGQDKCRQ